MLRIADYQERAILAEAKANAARTESEREAHLKTAAHWRRQIELAEQTLAAIARRRGGGATEPRQAPLLRRDRPRCGR
jgi:hypothetical protein